MSHAQRNTLDKRRTPLRKPVAVDTTLSRRLQPRGRIILPNVLIYLGLPGMSDGIAGPDPGVAAVPHLPFCPPWDWMNRPCTLPLSDSTLETPVVMSTRRRSPRSTFWHWVSTTGLPAPASMVMRLVFVSNTAVSPVTTWSFWVTTTLPRASSRLIEELPPGPGVADWIGAAFAPFAAAGCGGAGLSPPES